MITAGSYQFLNGSRQEYEDSNLPETYTWEHFIVGSCYEQWPLLQHVGRHLLPLLVIFRLLESQVKESGFLWGVVVGAALVFFVIYVLLFNPFGDFSTRAIFVEQFQPLRFPKELKQFLKGNGSNRLASEWESCLNLSLIIHFLFQEHKDTRRLRRWVHKKLQLELSDLTTRNTAGRFVQDIRIRDLSVGSKSPVIKAVRVEDYEISKEENFKTLKLLIDVDYTGGFQSSVDVTMLFGQFAQLSIKIDSLWQGKQVKHLIPFITQKFRRMVQRKHVWPNYKIRYRPLFPNPLYQPSPPAGAFEHKKITGLLEVTVLRCTRLNTALVNSREFEVFCVVSIDHQPLMQDANRSSTRCVTILLNFNRYDISDSIGLTFSKFISDAGVRSVQVLAVESSSSAERCGFKAGDVVLAVNNVPITSERQLAKLLSGTSGELSVLVDRVIYEKSNTPLDTSNNGKNDSASLGDFDDVSFPENFENVVHRSRQMELSKKGCHQRSRSASTVNSNTASNDFAITFSRDIKMARLCAGGKFSNLSKILNQSNMMKMVHPGTECSTSLNKHDQEIEKSRTNMVEDFVMASKVINKKNSSTGSLNAYISPENSTKDFIRSLSRRERLQARAAEMAAAGRAKVSDFWYRHKSSGAEVAMDVLLSHHDVDVGDRDNHGRCAAISSIETKERNPFIRVRRPLSSQNNGSDDVCDLLKVSSSTVITKSLTISEDVLWDESLLFDLTGDTCKYLNITVRARSLNVKATISRDNQVKKDGIQTLGYASIYIPQVLDDCQLTLSNCHQELFTLRPPFWTGSRRPLTPKAAEESCRAGFDERLCYGDIALGFRSADCVKSNTEIRRKKSLEASSEMKHHFEGILLRGTTVCGVCQGKVWLKLASHCRDCLLVCHNKCLPRVETTCLQRRPIDDCAYEERPLSPQRRIAFKVSERISSTWKSVRRKRMSFRVPKENQEEMDGQKTPIAQTISEAVPVVKTIPDVFSMLELSESLREMMYQPGNAYNEQMINAAKMEKIRNVIHQTTAERLNAMKNMKKNARSSGCLNFAMLEDRLQALAVLMLHYCAALQNCIDLEENCEYLSRTKNISDGAQDTLSTNSFSEASEAKCAEDEFILGIHSNI
uniref:PDZ domain-containing protein 8 n=1 Tax=Setaria digitata TaxID=48799 RepID=A0A915PCA3_9BILA